MLQPGIEPRQVLHYLGQGLVGRATRRSLEIRMTRWCWKDEDYKGQRRHEVQVKEGQDIWANSCQWVETQSETNFETGNVVPWMSVMLFIHALPQGYVCTQKLNNNNNNSYPLRESNLKPGTVLPVLYQIPTYMYTICVTYLTLTNIAPQMYTALLCASTVSVVLQICTSETQISQVTCLWSNI